jgi:MFS family permease
MGESTHTSVAASVRHHFFIEFAMLSLVMGISIGLAKVTTSLYAVHLGASGLWLAALAAAQSVGILMTALPAGHLVETFGARRLFILGSLVGGLLYVALPLVPAVGYLLLLTLLTGLVMPARFVSLQSIFMALIHQAGAGKAGWQRAAHMSGMFLVGPTITGLVIAHWGYAGSFWLVAALFGATLVLAHHVLRPPLPPITAPHRPQGSLVAQLSGLLKVADARRLAGMEASIQALNMFHAFFIVVIAVDHLNHSPIEAGLLVAVQGAMFIGALLLLGHWVQQQSRRSVMGLGAGLVVCACLLLGFSHGYTGLWLGSAIAGLGLGLLEVQVVSAMATLGARQGQGRMAGLNAVAGPGGGLLGGMLGGGLGVWWGLQTGFLMFIPLFLWMAVLSSWPRADTI